jgi:hypothetical protein
MEREGAERHKSIPPIKPTGESSLRILPCDCILSAKREVSSLHVPIGQPGLWLGDRFCSGSPLSV